MRLRKGRCDVKVLLIEDDIQTAKAIKFCLMDFKIDVAVASLGEDGIFHAKNYNHDIILLDLNLPDMSGFDVIREMRASRIDTPVIMLSGDFTREAKVKALNLGADDCMTKPFFTDDLIARIRSLARRARGHTSNDLDYGRLVVSLNRQAALVDGNQVHLTGKEFKILELLALRKGGVVAKEVIMDHLYGGIDEPQVKVIDIFICKLRRKLLGAGITPIETVWGGGYKINTMAELI